MSSKKKNKNKKKIYDTTTRYNNASLRITNNDITRQIETTTNAATHITTINRIPLNMTQDNERNYITIYAAQNNAMIQ